MNMGHLSKLTSRSQTNIMFPNGSRAHKNIQESIYMKAKPVSYISRIEKRVDFFSVYIGTITHPSYDVTMLHEKSTVSYTKFALGI
jgi:hypothetical protein